MALKLIEIAVVFFKFKSIFDLEVSGLFTIILYWGISSVQSLSCVRLFVTQVDSGTPGLPVHHQLLELAQTHVYRVGDAIQPSHPLSFPCPPAFSLSQNQGLFQ